MLEAGPGFDMPPVLGVSGKGLEVSEASFTSLRWALHRAGSFLARLSPVVPKRLIFAAPFVSLPGNRRRLSARNHAALPRVPSAQEAPPDSGPRRPMRQSPRSGGSRSRFGGRAGPLRGSRQRGMVQKLPSQAGRTQEAGGEARLRLQLPGPAGRFAFRLQCMWRGSRSDGVRARVCVFPGAFTFKAQCERGP